MMRKGVFNMNDGKIRDAEATIYCRKIIMKNSYNTSIEK